MGTEWALAKSRNRHSGHGAAERYYHLAPDQIVRKIGAVMLVELGGWHVTALQVPFVLNGYLLKHLLRFLSAQDEYQPLLAAFWYPTVAGRSFNC